MYRQRIGLGLNKRTGLDLVETVPLLKEIGFEAFFSIWEENDLQRRLRRAADDCGIRYQSIHAPFSGLRHLWQDDEKAGKIMDRLYACLDDCADVGVDLMVSHVYIGFDPAEPTLAGVRYFEKLADRAGELGIRIAFENTEGEAFLAAVMDDLKEEDYVGFCWDSGHELCYNHGEDQLARYGDRLFCTHLNDNLGTRDYDGTISPQDDLHLLPFDGIADWQGVADRLDRWGFDDVMMFELLKSSDRGRREHGLYDGLSPELYLTAAYQRACRVAWLRKR